MLNETLTLRAALGQKKLCDKKIEDLSNIVYCIAYDSSSKIIDGMTIPEWEKHVDAAWQSMNDLIARRNALEKAILAANTSNYIKVPRFKTLESLGSGEEEEISYAAAIARKNYYKGILQLIVNKLERLVSTQSSKYETKIQEIRRYIDNRLVQEFGQTTNASSTQRANREAELKKQFEAIFNDPTKLVSKLKGMREAIAEYLESIDAKLGHATEVTEVEIEY